MTDAPEPAAPGCIHPRDGCAGFRRRSLLVKGNGKTDRNTIFRVVGQFQSSW
jgi:hypothetical protein